MKFLSTEIKEVIIIEPNIFQDDRGFFRVKCSPKPGQGNKVEKGLP